MIRSFACRLRLTLPPLWTVAIAATLLIATELLSLWVACQITWTAAMPFLRMRDHLAALFAVAYGIYRVAAFHPLFRPKYRVWLELTPWTVRKKLPLGPIHLVWQDAVVLGLLAACLHGTTMGRFGMLEAFLFSYLAILGVSFWATGPWWMSYLVLAGLGLATRMVECPMAFPLTLVILYAIAFVGHRMALANFPWPEVDGISESLTRNLQSNSKARRKPLLGWPFGQLAGMPPKNRVRRRDGFLGPLLAAWWLYVLVSITHESEAQITLAGLSLTYLGAGAFVARLLIYIGPHRPPISLWGRIMTRHWIIPGYDCVLLAPLCMLFVALIGILLGMTVPLLCRASIVYPLTLAAILMIALNMGPSLGTWLLTGQHRMVACGNKYPQQTKL